MVPALQMARLARVNKSDPKGHAIWAVANQWWNFRQFSFLIIYIVSACRDHIGACTWYKSCSSFFFSRLQREKSRFRRGRWMSQQMEMMLKEALAAVSCGFSIQTILFCWLFSHTAIQDMREASTAKGSAIYCFRLGKVRFGRIRRVEKVMRLNELKQLG